MSGPIFSICSNQHFQFSKLPRSDVEQGTGNLPLEGSNQNDAASSSQVWLTDAKMSERARKLAAAGPNQDQSFPERARKIAAENSDIDGEDDSKGPQNYRISRANGPHLEKVHSNLRQPLKRKLEDKMEDFDVNTLIWRMFYDCQPTSRSSSWKRLLG